jgi:hypothetical protein
MRVVEGEMALAEGSRNFRGFLLLCGALMRKEHRAARRGVDPTMYQVMDVRYFVSTIAAMALLFAACSSGGGYSSGSYDTGGGYGATSTGSGGTLGSEVHEIVHENKEDARIRKAEKTEALLNTSGFKSMPIDTPAKQKVIGGLTPLSFNQLAHHGKIHYWFADPYYCKCVYVGDELAYLRYKQAKKERKQQNIEEANLIDQENTVDMPMDSEWDPVSAFGMP